MEISTDIKFLPADGLYQLSLPEPVAAVLQLTEPGGNSLFIIHKNKMQLEWLAQKIADVYDKLKNTLMRSKERLKKKKKQTIIILIFAILAGLFNSSISRITHIDILYIKIFAFTIGIVCLMQLLKYYALGINQTRSIYDPQLLELKEMILKDYSPED